MFGEDGEMKLYLNGDEITITDIPTGSVLICQPRGKRPSDEMRRISEDVHRCFKAHGIKAIVAPDDFDFTVIEVKKADER